MFVSRETLMKILCASETLMMRLRSFGHSNYDSLFFRTPDRYLLILLPFETRVMGNALFSWRSPPIVSSAFCSLLPSENLRIGNVLFFLKVAYFVLCLLHLSSSSSCCIFVLFVVYTFYLLGPRTLFRIHLTYHTNMWY